MKQRYTLFPALLLSLLGLLWPIQPLRVYAVPSPQAISDSLQIYYLLNPSDECDAYDPISLGEFIKRLCPLSGLSIGPIHLVAMRL
jgi:hypothetical protein